MLLLATTSAVLFACYLPSAVACIIVIVSSSIVIGIIFSAWAGGGRRKLTEQASSTSSIRPARERDHVKIPLLVPSQHDRAYYLLPANCFIIMPTVIQTYEDGSGGGLSGEHEHELCALAGLTSDPSDEPTEVTVLLFNNERDNEQQENVGTLQLSVPSLMDEHSLFDDIDSGSSPSVMDMSLSKKMPKKALAANHIQVGELKEVNRALNNHMSAVLALLRQTAAETVKSVPESLLNPLREQTMAALRDADYCFPLSRALLVPEKDAIQLYAEEVKKKKEHQILELEAMNGGTDKEGQFETKTKAVLVASTSGNNATLPTAAAATSKRPRSESEHEKESVKKRSKKCSWEGCTNRVYKGGVCKRHGAKVKLCSTEGCTNHAKKGGVCVRHGAPVKQCIIEGCTNQVVKGGVCVRHGATQTKKRCSSEGCTKHAEKGGVCWKHGAKDLKKTKCRSEGCTNQALKGGVCWSHGAKDLNLKKKA